MVMETSNVQQKYSSLSVYRFMDQKLTTWERQLESNTKENTCSIMIEAVQSILGITKDIQGLYNEGQPKKIIRNSTNICTVRNLK